MGLIEKGKGIQIILWILEPELILYVNNFDKTLLLLLLLIFI